MLTVGSLFAGIGGFDLGLERAGMRSVWQCEIDPFCQRVLEKHWPDVLRVPDVRDVGPGTVPWVDIICGGFPCQDLSYAGKGTGIDGERSGLWSEYARVIRELRPRYVIVENVSALLARGLGRVLGDLAAIRYDAEWDCIPASAVGAPHRRDRIWLVAYPQQSRLEGHGADTGQPEVAEPRDGCALGDAEGNGRGSWRPGGSLAASAGEREPERTLQDPDTDRGRLEVGCESHGGEERPGLEASQRHDADGLRSPVADAARDLRAGPSPAGAERERARQGREPGGARAVADAEGQSVRAGLRADEPRGEWRGRSGDGGGSGDWWSVEPDVGRVAHGVPARVDRLRSLGNALVPQIAEWLGRRIIDYEEGRLAA